MPKGREYIHKNVTGNTAVELSSRHDSNNDYDIFSMTLANIHASDVVTIDLYITKLNASIAFAGIDGDWNEPTTSSTTLYILKAVDIDAGNTLVLETNEVDFDTTLFDFYIKLNNSDSTVDVIINKKLN